MPMTWKPPRSGSTEGPQLGRRGRGGNHGNGDAVARFCSVVTRHGSATLSIHLPIPSPSLVIPRIVSCTSDFICYKLHRENGEDGSTETLPSPSPASLSFLLPFLPPFTQLCSAAPTFICCHSYHGAVHFFCSDLVRCSTCHSLLPSLLHGLTIGPPSPRVEQSHI